MKAATGLLGEPLDAGHRSHRAPDHGQGRRRHERPTTRPRTHFALRVEVPGHATPHLADSGFGSVGALIEPIPFTPDVEHLTDRHRLLRAPPAQVTWPPGQSRPMVPTAGRPRMY
ncbi:arylamine N-acetyltransferase [Streptomyces sp. NPDC004609]|uniref:arylamine N-acetyltransferase n=1 Tax=Streptomyces sp. NPDC004609 TaxID=3364704 RepID=UPI0036CC0DEA